MAERNRRKMDFNQLSYFIAIARNGNFTAAAKAFFVSQPCISHQIQSLEKELGVRLFIRNTRSVELTAAGEIFLEDAKKMVDLMERAKNRLLQNDGDSMRLSVAHLASPSHLFFTCGYPALSAAASLCSSADESDGCIWHCRSSITTSV